MSRSARSTNARCTCCQQRVDGVDGIADEQLQIGGDLVVAAAAGVQLAADVAQPLDQGRLDVHVDVFELGAERELRRARSAAPMSSRTVDDLLRIRRR